MNLYTHSDLAVIDITNLFKKHSKVVLAASPAGGKTWMSYEIALEYIKNNPGKRVLVLTHGQRVLRTQYFEELQGWANLKHDGILPFKADSAESPADVIHSTADMVITLPHSFKGMSRKNFPKFGLVIIDEAHQFYFGEKMVPEILEKTKHDLELLLTGTPSPFILANSIKQQFHIYAIAMADLLASGAVSNVTIELASTNLNILDSDYNESNNLKNTALAQLEGKITPTLDLLLEVILDKLKSIYRANPERYSESRRGLLKTVLKWDYVKAFGYLEKTMIACPSIDIALKVAHYFEKHINGQVCISHSKNDKYSKEIKKFKDDPSKLLLVTVDRGVLGFNLPDMCTVIDMTGSRNIDRIYQLMCRASRRSTKGKDKLFIKVVPISMAEYFSHVLMATVCLMDKKWLLLYNGKNFLDMFIPRKIKKKKPNDKDKIREPGIREPSKNPTLKDYIGIPDLVSFRDILHVDGSILNGYKYAKLVEVRSELLNIMQYNIWNKDLALLKMKEYKSRQALTKDAPGLLFFLKENCLEELDSFFPKKGWSKESAIKEMKKYKSRDAMRKDNSGLKSFLERECSKEFDSFLPKLKGLWSKEKAFKEMQKYKTRTSLYENNNTLYTFLRNNFPKHLNEKLPSLLKFRTKESAIKEMRKFKSRDDMQGTSLYIFLLKNCKKELDKYFPLTKINWDKEIALKEMRKHKSRSNFGKACSAGIKFLRINHPEELAKYFPKNKIK